MRAPIFLSMLPKLVFLMIGPALGQFLEKVYDFPFGFACFSKSEHLSVSGKHRNALVTTTLQIGGTDFRIGEKFKARSTHGDRAVDHHIPPVRQFQRAKGILFNQKHR